MIWESFRNVCSGLISYLPRLAEAEKINKEALQIPVETNLLMTIMNEV